jgi:hypothetical protein
LTTRAARTSKGAGRRSRYSLLAIGKDVRAAGDLVHRIVPAAKVAGAAPAADEGVEQHGSVFIVPHTVPAEVKLADPCTLRRIDPRVRLANLPAGAGAEAAALKAGVVLSGLRWDAPE